MIINGIIGKNVLCLAAVFHPLDNFDKIDGCLDNLLIGGIVLVGGTILEKFIPLLRKK